MRDYVVVDDFGRRTQFSGEKLVDESTDNEDGSKPQWLEVTVWRTRGGSYVVQRATHYRIRHLRENCPRAQGYELLEATSLDTYPCPNCNKSNAPGGCAQASRISVDAYYSPEELIASFQQTDGRFNNLARTILADLSEQDSSIDEKWNTVIVP